MSIKQNGGVFGRNPTFNDVTIDGTLTFNGDIDIDSDLKVAGDLDVTGAANLASLNVFESAGFESFASDESMIVLRRDYKEVSFKEVNDQDAKVLLKLLENRDYSISHLNLPSKNDHLLFIKSKPYRYWAIVIEDNLPVGTVYIQSNNSIGLNLLQQKKQLVHKILRHIKTSFNPLKEVKSKAPPYFYVNISYANNKLGKILCELDASPIQVSYKI